MKSDKVTLWTYHNQTTFLLVQAEAKRVGSPFFTLDDVLLDSERRYRVPSSVNDFADVDDLNRDIAKAALRLVARSTFFNS